MSPQNRLGFSDTLERGVTFQRSTSFSPSQVGARWFAWESAHSRHGGLDSARRRSRILADVSAVPGYQLVAFSGDQVRTFDLPDAGEMTIGRDEASMVRIDDPSVSRRHAVLRVAETLEIEDLGGANGTFVRQTVDTRRDNETVSVNVQQVLRRRAKVAVGDCLLFGTTCVVVRRQPAVVIPDIVSGAVVRDPAMKTLYTDAARAARASINVLLLGETGVGKEVLARAIHSHSPRAGGPFMAINCAALAESLLDSELFGSEKGAFTGALTRVGIFEAAGGGTLFLDEVGELPLGTQAKLLRVLEERVVTRLGSTRARPIDVRFVAATNRDLEADSRQGRLRSDLYYRLNGIALVIPPLRERPLEIEALATSFLAAACRDLDRRAPLTFSTAALELLRRHGWPGNVRELRNTVERAAVMCTDSSILPEHLPPSLSSPAPTRPAAAPTLHAEMKAIERSRIVEALDRCEGNQSEAARQLGMPRRTLVSRLRELGLGRRRSSGGETE